MINSITGQITQKLLGLACLETHGIEWMLEITRTTYDSLPEPGESVRLYVHLHHKEDQMRLFGFSSKEEKELFLNLLKVTGIGPKQALKILSGMSIDHFLGALDQGNVDLLAQIPGLGKKTAQKIVLALSGKLSLSSQEESESFREITNGLVEMGFDKKRVAQIVKEVVGEVAENGMTKELEQEIFKKAIMRLSV